MSIHQEPVHRSWFIAAPLTLAICTAVIVLWPRKPIEVKPAEPDVPFIAAVRKAGYCVVYHSEDQPALYGPWYVTRSPRPLKELRAIHAFVPSNADRFKGVVMVSVEADTGAVHLLGDAELRREIAAIR